MEFTYFVKLTFHNIIVLADKDGSADTIYSWQKFDLLLHGMLIKNRMTVIVLVHIKQIKNWITDIFQEIILIMYSSAETVIVSKLFDICLIKFADNTEI